MSINVLTSEYQKHKKEEIHVYIDYNMTNKIYLSAFKFLTGWAGTALMQLIKLLQLKLLKQDEHPTVFHTDNLKGFIFTAAVSQWPPSQLQLNFLSPEILILIILLGLFFFLLFWRFVCSFHNFTKPQTSGLHPLLDWLCSCMWGWWWCKILIYKQIYCFQ